MVVTGVVQIIRSVIGDNYTVLAYSALAALVKAVACTLFMFCGNHNDKQ